MRILFLDDNTARHVHAKKAYEGHDVDYVFTAAEAIEKLKTNPPYDLVSLDHDLGGQTFVKSDEQSGYEVCKYIVFNMGPAEIPKKAIIHSWNPAGANNMMAMLNGVVPVIKIPFQV